MRDFTLLLQRDLRITLNYIKAIKHNPKRLLIFVLYTAYMGWIVSMNLGSMKGEVAAVSVSTISLGILGFSAFFMLTNITASVKDQVYLFKAPDIHMVFTSPLNERAVLAAAVVKSFMGSLLLMFFLMLMLSRWMISASVPWYSYLIVILTMVTFSMSFQPFNFLLSRLKKWVKPFYIQMVITAAWVGPTLALLAINRLDFIAFSVDPNTDLIPIIGWLKAIVLGCYGQNNGGLWLYAGLYALYILVIFGGSLLWATDYYEDMISGAEFITNARRRAKEGNYQTKGIKGFRERRLKGGHERDRGATAFYWQEKAISNKRNFHYLFGFKEMFYLIGAICAVAASYLLGDNMDWVGYGYNGAILYLTFIMSISVKNQANFMTARFIMVPEAGVSKLFNLYRLDITRFALSIAAVNLILCFAQGANPLLLLGCIAGQIIVYIEILYINIMMMVFFQNSTDYNLMLPIVKILQIIFFIVPNAAVAAGVGIWLDSIFWVVFAVAALNILMVACFVAASGLLARSIEVSR